MQKMKIVVVVFFKDKLLVFPSCESYEKWVNECRKEGLMD